MFFISAKAKRNNQKLEQYARRRTAWFLGITFIISNIIAPVFVMAAPQVFSRPGAGVSRMPLGVGGVSAPGYGELSEAVNIANGNVYVDTGDVARNNQITSGDDSIGGGQWQLKQRLRLNGFSKIWGSSELSANRITQQNPASAYWEGYWAKPNVQVVNRFAPSDGGCSANASGLLRTASIGEGLSAGRYRISAEVRADQNMVFYMGPTDYSVQAFTATPQWQTFSFEVDLTEEDPQRQGRRFFEIAENVANNPSWEVSNMVLQAYVGGGPDTEQSQGNARGAKTRQTEVIKNGKNDTKNQVLNKTVGSWSSNLIQEQNASSSSLLRFFLLSRFFLSTMIATPCNNSL